MNADKPKGYENPDLIWSPAQLKERLGDPNLRIIDTRPGERFAMGHIPGARHFNVYGINCDDSSEAPLHSFLRMWAFLLGNRGVSFENTIVFYDDMVGNTCVRGFWFLELFGHGDVHVLDGGYGAWERAGLDTTRDAEPPKAAKFEFNLQRDRLATDKDVLAAIDDENHVLLDTRSEGEWNGTSKRAKRGGALPGAVWQEWLGHLTPDGEMKPAEELRALFEAIGVTPEKEVTAY
jgi:thiosulfate/3-mercaptopyruvate sulfurtransferase